MACRWSTRKRCSTGRSMTYESELEAADLAAREYVQGAYARALALQAAMFSGKRIAGNVVLSARPTEEDAA